MPTQADASGLHVYETTPLVVGITWINVSMPMPADCPHTVRRTCETRLISGVDYDPGAWEVWGRARVLRVSRCR